MSPLTAGASEALLRRNRFDHYWRTRPNPLDPAAPVAITEPARIYTAVAVDMDFAHVRARYDRTDYRVAKTGCPRCGQCGDQPCHTRSGKPTRRHAGRGRV